MRLIFVALVFLAVGATPALAADWSTPALLQTERCEIVFCSSAPAVAINARGTVVASYRRERDLRAFLRIGDAGGRFGPAQALPAAAHAAGVAVAEDGTAVAAWAQKGQVRAAFRRPGHRFGRSLLVARLAGRESAIDDVLVGLDRTGALGVVAWRDFAT